MKKFTIIFLFIVSVMQAQWHCNGLSAESCLDICEHNSNLYVITESGNIYYASTFGYVDGVWTLLPEISGRPNLKFIHSANNRLYVGGSDGLYRSTDMGQSFDRIIPQPVLGLADASGTELYVIVQDQGIYYSDNRFISYYPKMNGISDAQVTRVVVNGQYIFAATQNGNYYVSTDSGANWELKNSGLPSVAIWPMYSATNMLFAGSNNRGIFRSNNWGYSWEQLGANFGSWLDMLAIGQTLCLFGDPTYKFSVTPDGGNTWQQQTDGFSLTTHIKAAIHFYDFIYVAASDGVWRRWATEVTTGIENNEIPVSYALQQNYPNPFNPTTTIKYSIPSVETLHATSLQQISLKVYDALGREITTLVNETKPPGTYSVKFNAGSLPSGVYFYRIISGEFSQTKKFILLK